MGPHGSDFKKTAEDPMIAGCNSATAPFRRSRGYAIRVVVVPSRTDTRGVCVHSCTKSNCRSCLAGCAADRVGRWPSVDGQRVRAIWGALQQRRVKWLTCHRAGDSEAQSLGMQRLPGRQAQHLWCTPGRAPGCFQGRPAQRKRRLGAVCRLRPIAKHV